jgi:aspartate 1-decarboxylase
MNCAAAHLIREGEEVIIMDFELSDKPIGLSVNPVDKNNAIVSMTY